MALFHPLLAASGLVLLCSVLAETDDVVHPLLFASETLNARIVQISLSSLQRLIQHKAVPMVRGGEGEGRGGEGRGGEGRGVNVRMGAKGRMSEGSKTQFGLCLCTFVGVAYVMCHICSRMACALASIWP